MQKIGFCDRYGLTTAVLNGTKTMTRRIIHQKVVEYALNVYRQDYYSAALDYLNDKECLEGWLVVEKKSRYKLNETVAVAQAYKNVFSDNDLAVFDDGLEIKLSKGWNNKLFVKPDLMPHQIQITDIKIERLQDITDEDCLKEGVCKFDYGYYVPNLYRIPSRGVLYSYKTPRAAFAALIDRPGVGRKGLWESNPWVICYSFKLVK